MTDFAAQPSSEAAPELAIGGLKLDDVKALASDAADRAQQAAEEVRRRVVDGAGVARDWAADQSDVLRDTVQTKPFIAVGVSAGTAFAAGLVLGVLLTRR